MMINKVRDWLASILPADKYTANFGEWVESTADKDKFYLVVSGSGGASPNVKARQPNFHIVLLGPRNKRNEAASLNQDIESIMSAAMDHNSVPCGATIITPIGEPVGPGFTTENRAFMQLDLRVIF